MPRLVECIPNFSISKEKNEAGYAVLVAVAQSVPGCTLFDVHTDGFHNRSVFTMVGSPESVEEAAFRMIRKATELIDMNRHVGKHARMGATDVVPFIPVAEVTLQDCVEMSRNLGRRVWDELKIPVFLYENSAVRPERENLSNIRRGEFEGMAQKLLLPEWEPDFGERKIHPTAGVTAMGARMPLVAFNVNLATQDLEIAKKIAKVIRGSSGGFRYCKAMGFLSEERGLAQVSMNMTNYQGTPLYMVFEQIKALAERYGTHVVDTEIIGTTPAQALIDCAEFYLRTRNFDSREQIMEYHLMGME